MDGDIGRDERPGLSLPASALVSNLETIRIALTVGPRVLPMTRNDGLRPTNYICCPSTAYLDYACEELRHFSALLRMSLRALIELARPLMKASGLDRQVQPNNALVATNLYPDLQAADVVAATGLLIRQYPDHAIVWRSLNAASTKTLKSMFEAAGYEALVSRQIYLFDARSSEPKVSRDEARDMRLLARADYDVVTGAWSEDDFRRMAWLYQRLYLDKYTRLNPAYTPRFLEMSYDSGFMEFYGLRGVDGRLDGIVGVIEAGDTMAAPIVGYDTNLPVELGLYRRLMAIALRRARAKRLLYNMSAGAGAFKRNRGGIPTLEYMMVYDRHLSLTRRVAGQIVRTILQAIGVPLLKRFEL